MSNISKENPSRTVIILENDMAFLKTAAAFLNFSSIKVQNSYSVTKGAGL